MSDELTIVDVGDEVYVKAKRTRHKTKEQQEDEDLRALLGSYPGRAFLWRLLAECQIYSKGLMSTPELTAHRLGKHDIGLWVIEAIERSQPDAYLMMQNEASVRKKEDS